MVDGLRGFGAHEPHSSVLEGRYLQEVPREEREAMKIEDVKVGMEVEATIYAGRWFPAKVTRKGTPRSGRTDMFWAVVTYDDGIKGESMFYAHELRPIAKDKP